MRLFIYIAAVVLLLISIVLAEYPTASVESTCFGTTKNGRLENGVPISKSGDNFSSYSKIGVTLRRTYVHSKVADTILEAYEELKKTSPEKHYVYGESGWPSGGRLRPHRTHQNGLSVDFMVPVIDQDGKSVALPTTILNKLGYGIEFDDNAQYENLSIDFEAIADHLLALEHSARANGIGIDQVIFDSSFIPRLFATKQGELVKKSVKFMQGKPWIRHDEHYHVDFAVECQKIK